MKLRVRICGLLGWHRFVDGKTDYRKHSAFWKPPHFFDSRNYKHQRCCWCGLPRVVRIRK